MDLIEFKRSSCRGDLYPALTVSTKGALRFNKPAVEAYGLKAGDKVSFFQDKNQPIDWYLKFGSGAILRKPGSDNGSLVFNFVTVARMILSAVKKDKASIRLATEPVDGYFAILTRSV